MPWDARVGVKRLLNPLHWVLGGHVAAGCIVRTTTEVLLALLSEWDFARELDAATGFYELVIRPVSD